MPIEELTDSVALPASSGTLTEIPRPAELFSLAVMASEIEASNVRLFAEIDSVALPASLTLPTRSRFADADSVADVDSDTLPTTAGV
jgi:hypothetical protein